MKATTDRPRARSRPPRVLSKENDMDPLAVLGVLAVIIGVVGVIVLMKGKIKKVR